MKANELDDREAAPANFHKAWRPGRAQKQGPLWSVLGLGVLCALAQPVEAQSCRLHYAEAFQLLSKQSFEGHRPATNKQRVDYLFGPPQLVCEENDYRFFLTELQTLAATAMRKRGNAREARLAGVKEIMNYFPLRVRFSDGADPAAGLNQLRSNLGVLSQEVRKAPSIRELLDALAKLEPPRNAPKPWPTDDEAIPITVPRIPLPTWAVISLYEVRDHATRQDSVAVRTKINLILDWMAMVSTGDRVKETPGPGPEPGSEPGPGDDLSSETHSQAVHRQR